MPVIDVDDLFEETRTTSDEQAVAYYRVHDLIDKFLDENGWMPSRIYINKNEELQSFMMYSAHLLGLSIDKTDKETYVG